MAYNPTRKKDATNASGVLIDPRGRKLVYQKGHHPGTIWLKSDLQCHTPRDLSWRGAITGLPGGNETAEESRRSWARSFLDACETRGLGVVAITDHHDFCMAEYVAEEASAYENIMVFRGIEVTCQDNVQCIVLFDPSSNKRILSKFMGMLTGIMEAGEHEANAPPTQPCRMNLTELFEAVQSEPLIREHCILLPHFSHLEAHKSANSQGHHLRFAELACDGVYVEVPYDELDITTRNKIWGYVPAWGKRRRAIIATGDNKTETWDRLGQYNCWLKLGEHSLEALRQAMLADEARISFEEPQIPSERITQLTICSTLTGNEELSLTFNAGFNALIGGRGSGKSSFIEYLRFGLARTAADLRLLDGASPRERDEKLIDDTLQDGGFVTITLERDGVPETWRRTYADRDRITISDRKHNETTLSLDDARRRFPARAFEQKGLSSTMNDPAKAADQITGIAAAEELDLRREVDESIVKSKRAITTALQQAAAYWQLLREEKRMSTLVTDLKERLAANTERLQADGISDAAMKILEKAPEYSRASSYIRSIQVSKETIQKKLSGISDDLLKFASVTYPTTFPYFSKIQTAADTARQNIQSLLENIQIELENFQDILAETATEHKVDNESFDKSHKEAIDQQSAHRLAIEDNQRLTKEFEAAIEKERIAKEAAAEQANCVTRLQHARLALRHNIGRRREILQDAAEKVAGHSGGTLKAKVKTDPQPDDYLKALEIICNGSYLQDARDRCRQRAQQLKLVADWEELCNTIEEIYREKIIIGTAPDPSGAQAARLGEALFGNESNIAPRTLGRFFDSLNDQVVGNFLAAAPRDYIALTYVDELGRNIGFERASPGQQASALLELLLRQSAGTLIIDQPEDDLDNKVVMKVVDLVRNSKSRRQLIFATHNPNVVVNGDADKVITLTTGEPNPNPVTGSVRIAIEVDGAIETPAIKNAITHIMEGGEPAFELRRRKYRF